MLDLMETVGARLAASLNPVTIGEQFAALIQKLLIAGATFLAFYMLWVITGALLRRIMAQTDVDETASRFTLTIVKVVLLTIGVVNALAAVGINTASVLTSLGIAGLTIGFAARDGLSNIISGIFIFWDRPFVIGDLIEADGQYGRVEDITLRSTRVITPDGKMLSIPNSQLVNSTVASYTNFPNLRLDVAVTVSRAEEIDRIRQLLVATVADYPKYLQDPLPSVQVTDHYFVDTARDQGELSSATNGGGDRVTRGHFLPKSFER